MRVKASHFTHKGQLQENQDRAKILTCPYASLFVVADGLGGHSGAALGAQTVIDTANRLWEQDAASSDTEAFLHKLAIESHAAVNAAGREAGLEPRTTLVALLIKGSESVSVHAGDSRVIQLSDEGVVKRTLDHSIGQLSVLRGAITEKELATHPDQKKLFIHIGGETRPDYEINRWNLAEGHRFVVCSDGFWEIFSNEEIRALFTASDPIRQLEERFNDKLAALRGHDNTSAILVELKRDLQPSRLVPRLGMLSLIGLAIALPPSSRSAGRPLSPTSETVKVSIGSAAPLRPEPSLPALQSDVPTIRVEPSFTLALQAIPQEGLQSDSVGSQSDEQTDESGEVGQGRPTEELSARSGHAIPNESVNLRPDRVLREGESLSEAAEEELRKSDRLGTEDALVQSTEVRMLGGKSQVRLEQAHKGVRVFAAEIVITVEGNRLISIQGHTSPQIGVGTEPPKSYKQTVALARKAIPQRIETLDAGSLVIVAVEGGHRLGWLGLVAVDGVQERLIFAADTGEILFREPATIG